MRVLLDTSAFLWWITDLGARLSERARATVADRDNVVFVSVASAWEIGIKSGRGRLSMSEPVEEAVPRLIDRYEFNVLDIRIRHALRASALPDLHRDPFDRLLVAQCQIEKLPLVTSDAVIGRYDVETIW